MKKDRSGRQILLLIIAAFIGVYLLYQLITWCAKAFVFLGYNMFFYLDNLFTVPLLNPVAAWTLFGFFLGSVAGVLIAIKKFRLSKWLIFYPAAFVAIVLVVMSFINEPGNYTGTYSGVAEAVDSSVARVATLKFFYRVVSDTRVRSGPAINSTQLFTVKKGLEVEVDQPGTFDARRMQWIKIRYEGREGYISSRQLKYSRSGYE